MRFMYVLVYYLVLSQLRPISPHSSLCHWQALVQVKGHISISWSVSISKSYSKSDLDPGACNYNCNICITTCASCITTCAIHHKTFLSLLDLSITLEPMGRLLHMRGHFWVVFHAQSNVEVTVQISWHGRRPFHNFGTNGQNVAYEGSFWGSFSCPIQWWGHCTNQLTWKKTFP